MTLAPVVTGCKGGRLPRGLDEDDKTGGKIECTTDEDEDDVG